MAVEDITVIINDNNESVSVVVNETTEQITVIISEGGGGVSVHNELDGLNDGDYIHLTADEKTKLDSIPDSFAPVATSNDYNDLDNLPTIPTVPSFADQTETNSGLVSDKTIAPNTLAGWWTYVKGLAQTFSQKITFSLGVLFSPQVAPTYERGRIYFDDVNDCLSFMDSISGTSVQLGYETLMRARNNTGSTIPNGAVVYISGAIGQNPTIALAQSNTEPTSEIIGIATHNISNNTVGKVCVFGIVNDVDTSDFDDGDLIFLSSSVAGGLTATPPTSPNYVVSVGVIEHAHVTQGKILVKPQRALSNNNALGTSQKIGATEMAVKTYVDSKPNFDVFDLQKYSLYAWRPTPTGWYGFTTPATVGTADNQSPLFSGNDFIRSVRQRRLSGATAGSSSEYYETSFRQTSVGDGFFFSMKFGNEDVAPVANARLFAGLTGLGAIGNVNPSTLGSMIGVGADSGDTNLQFMHNDSAGTAVKVDLGSNYPANSIATDLYCLQMYNVRGQSSIWWRVLNVTSSIATPWAQVTSELPATSFALIPHCWRNNGTTALAVRLSLVDLTLYKNI